MTFVKFLTPIVTASGGMVGDLVVVVVVVGVDVDVVDVVVVVVVRLIVGLIVLLDEVDNRLGVLVVVIVPLPRPPVPVVCKRTPVILT